MRELRAADADRVAALFVECFGEARLVDPDEVRSWLRNREFQPDWLRVLEEDGRVVGYGDIWPQDEALYLDVAAPGRWDAFFTWAEDEARARGVGSVRVQIPHDHPLAAAAAARGYQPWRCSLTMEIALEAAPPPARLPEGIDLRPYRDEDVGTLVAALNESFVDDPKWQELTPAAFGEFYLRARGFDPSLWLLAWGGDELAGFALDYPEHGSDAGIGWVGILGVRPPWRRRGLGEALLLASFAALRARGLRRVGLAVDAENATGALRLYERVGMHVERRSDNWQKDV